MSSIWSDIRYALRGFRRSLLFTTVVVSWAAEPPELLSLKQIPKTEHSGAYLAAILG